MRILKVSARTLLWLLGAAVLAVAVSCLFERENGVTLLSFAGLRLTVTGVGGAAAFLTIVLFCQLWVFERRKRKEASAAVWANAFGFGLLPGAVVWKIFEHRTVLGTGTALFEPLRGIPFLTAEGCFLPSRIELVLAGLCFAAVVLWLILRREDLPDNGDLLLTALCIWTTVRAFTEGFRAFPFLRAGKINLTQILLLAGAYLALGVWSRRPGRTQKSTAFTVLEWVIAVGCGIVMVLHTAGILTVGSAAADTAVNAGCTILSMLLILLAGKDSRN